MRNRQKSIHLAIGLLVGLFFVCHPAYGKVPDIIKTHPAFKGAPLPTYTSYQGKIELQGDHKQKVKDFLIQMGFAANTIEVKQRY